MLRAPGSVSIRRLAPQLAVSCYAREDLGLESCAAMALAVGEQMQVGMMGDTLIPVILCGGSGTRLWPLSRRQYPKQFLKLTGEGTLFGDTVARALALPGVERLLIVGNEAHRFLILDELEALGSPPAELLLEPVARNTAPALAVAAQRVRNRYPDALLLAMPADHYVADPDLLAVAVEHGQHAASEGAIVVFGVTPTQAHTGFGYICKGRAWRGDGLCEVAEFKEKPDAETAAAYVKSGEYLWNSGMFLVRAATYLTELEAGAPDIARAAAVAAEGISEDGAFLRIPRAPFEACRSDSIDYAVMERTHRSVVVTLNSGWSDLGSWSSLREVGTGSDGNVTHGDVLLSDVAGSVIHSSGRLVAAVGLRNHVVVETPDAVLVAPMDRAEEVKQLVTALQAHGRDEAENHLRVYRPWGWYECLARGERMQVKRIEVKPGARLSLQLHHHRAEHWVVVRGEAEVTRGDEVFCLRENQSTYIPRETKHRLSNQGSKPLEIIEVQSGDYLGEDDIERFDDLYGRVNLPLP